MNALLDIEDDLGRLISLLTLLQMASGDLIKVQRDAMFLGLETAIVAAAETIERLAAIRAGQIRGAA